MGEIINLFTDGEVSLNEVKPYIGKLENRLRTYTNDLFKDFSDSRLQDVFVISEIVKNPNFGFVYFLKNKDNELTKIGKTKNLTKRFKSLNQPYNSITGKNLNLEIEFLLFTHISILDNLEKDLHNIFKENRKQGEWFDLNDTQYKEEWLSCKVENINNIPVIISDELEFHLFPKIDKNEKFSLNEIFEYNNIIVSEFKDLFYRIANDTPSVNKLIQIINYLIRKPLDESTVYSVDSFKNKEFYKNKKYQNDILGAIKFIQSINKKN